jgi:hypothetical protein
MQDEKLERANAAMRERLERLAEREKKRQKTQGQVSLLAVFFLLSSLSARCAGPREAGEAVAGEQCRQASLVAHSLGEQVNGWWCRPVAGQRDDLGAGMRSSSRCMAEVAVAMYERVRRKAAAAGSRKFVVESCMSRAAA